MGIIPGAIALVTYACIRLAAQGDLAFVWYESYTIPIFVAGGGVVGVAVGARIGWHAGHIKHRGIASQIASWLVNGSIAGILLANLLAFAGWLTLGGGFEFDIVGELVFGGIVSGAIVAVLVGLMLRLTSHLHAQSISGQM